MLVDRVLNPPGPIVSQERMLRYYRILVRGAGIELSKPIPEGTSVATMWPLRRALPKIKVLDKRLYSDAQSIISKYRKSLSKNQITKEEADDRIDAAEDQLERAAAEAESASTPDLKDYLWNRASQIAQIKKNYRLATDLLMKARPTLGRTNQPKLRDQQLSTLAYWAQAYREFEPARYAVDQIKDDQIRAKSLLVYANEFGRWNLNRPNAAQMADEAIGQIEKAGPTADVICSMAIAVSYDPTNAFHESSGLYREGCANNQPNPIKRRRCQTRFARA